MDSLPQIALTDYAVNRASQRGISIDDVEYALSHVDSKYVAKNNVIINVATLPDGRTIKVATRSQDREPTLIVTLFIVNDQ